MRATLLANSVLPVPAGPSMRTGLPRRSAEIHHPGDPVVRQVVHAPQALADRRHRLESCIGHRPSLPSPLDRSVKSKSSADLAVALHDVLGVVSSRSPIGPRACSFWVLMPISAPNPNSSPSVNRVDALTTTAAASTSRVNRVAAGQVAGDDRLGVTRCRSGRCGRSPHPGVAPPRRSSSGRGTPGRSRPRSPRPSATIAAGRASPTQLDPLEGLGRPGGGTRRRQPRCTTQALGGVAHAGPLRLGVDGRWRAPCRGRRRRRRRRGSCRRRRSRRARWRARGWPRSGSGRRGGSGSR